MTPYACVAEYNAIQTWREEVPSSNRVRLSLPPTGNCEFKSSMISHLDFIHLPSIMQQVEILVKYNQLDFVISQLMETDKKPRAGTSPLIAVPLRLDLTPEQVDKILG